MDNEEIIFEGHDSGWDRSMPVRLITYESGAIDIHRQTGDQFDEHIKKADSILKKRGLKRVDNGEWFVGPTGAYQTVVKIDKNGGIE